MTRTKTEEITKTEEDFILFAREAFALAGIDPDGANAAPAEAFDYGIKAAGLRARYLAVIGGRPSKIDKPPKVYVSERPTPNEYRFRDYVEATLLRREVRVSGLSATEAFRLGVIGYRLYSPYQGLKNNRNGAGTDALDKYLATLYGERAAADKATAQAEADKATAQAEAGALAPKPKPTAARAKKEVAA